jgi:serine protease Do
MKAIKTSKTTYLTLALGFVMGGLAFASMQHVVPTATANSAAAQNPRTISGVTTESMAALRELDNSFASLAEFVSPTVVHIRSEGRGGRDMLGNRMGASSGVGSGVIYRSDGWIVTNDHVVAGYDKVTVILHDGREFPGEVRRAEDTDIAVVKINANNLPAASFGDSSQVRPGQFVMAVGSPFGLEKTVTIGHVSGLGRENVIADPRVPEGARLYTDMIQTDASINMGNSGGPLVNIEGQVVGINSSIISNSPMGGSVGIGFAIPSNQVRLIADMLIEKGRITRSYLGLTPKDLKEFEKNELKLQGGAMVEAVQNDGPAGRAGIRERDVILRVGTYPINSQIDVRNAMLRYEPGTKVPVEVLRNGQRVTLEVTLADARTERARARNQQAPQQQEQMDRFPFPDLEQFFPPRNRPDRGDANQPPATPREGNARLGVGVDTLNDTLRQQFDIPANVRGAVVTAVEPGSVAERLGIEPGWVIQQIGDKTIESAQDVVDAMSGVKWGETRTMRFGKVTRNMQMIQSLPVTFR